MFSDEEGKLAVRIARDVVDRHVRGERVVYTDYDVPERFHQKMGAFVTLKTFPAGELRGCIGFPTPIFPLIKAIVEAARSAATKDPRFFPVSPRELDHLVVEVSLLTPPVPLEASTPRERLEKVVIGKHGLIAERGPFTGLLLPQVPVEEGWDVKTFLEWTCMKAGLPRDAWKDPATRFYTFTAEVFRETTPRGDVVREELGSERSCC